MQFALSEADDDAPWTSPPSRRRNEPPIVGPLPETLDLILGNEIYIAKDTMPPAVRNRLLRLAAFQSRNALICEDVTDAVRQGRSPVVLTERTEHLAKLADHLTPAVRHVIVLQGGMGKKKLAGALAQMAGIPENEGRVLLATGRFLGEGFDDARLDTLFLTLPVSWRGTIAQYAGRLHRLHDRKREVRIYDYADLNAPVLARMFDRRCKGYEAIGYSILLPASAVPGWPAEVPPPVEPEWKRDYAASVQRLIRDGVDANLGNLFVHAARKIQPDAQGEDRARSATEAFLYRRLETLSETAGKFLVNAVLVPPGNETSSGGCPSSPDTDGRQRTGREYSEGHV